MNNQQKQIAKPMYQLLVALLSSLLALAGAGCGATKPGSASFASVVIRGHEPNEIRDVTIAVFQEEGYQAGAMGGQLVFQKEASRMTSLAYEGVVATHEGTTTLVRVKADLVNVGDGAYRLQCQAYVVKGAGDAFFSEEQRLANVRSGPYQAILDKVAKRLK
jgi:hypothetical protein